MSGSSLTSRQGSQSLPRGPHSRWGSGAVEESGASHAASAPRRSCPRWRPLRPRTAWGRGCEVPGWARADGVPWWHPRSRRWTLPRSLSSGWWSAPEASYRSPKRSGTTSSCAGSQTTRNSAGTFLWKTDPESVLSNINSQDQVFVRLVNELNVSNK